MCYECGLATKMLWGIENLFTDISSLLHRITQTQSYTSGSLLDHSGGFSNVERDKTYLNSLRTWLDEDYTKILTKKQNIDTSYNDLSRNYITSLSELEGEISDISNSKNIIDTSTVKEDVINNITQSLSSLDDLSKWIYGKYNLIFRVKTLSDGDRIIN